MNVIERIYYGHLKPLRVKESDGTVRLPNDNELSYLRGIADGSRGNICGQPIAGKLLREGGNVSSYSIYLIGNTHNAAGDRR